MLVQFRRRSGASESAGRVDLSPRRSRDVVNTLTVQTASHPAAKALREFGYAPNMPNSNVRLFNADGTLTLVDERAGSTAASRVTIAPHRGALVKSFRVRGRELLYLDEATFMDPAKNVRGGIPVLFPSPGKLEQDSWQQAGRSGVMKQHGFGRTLPWKVAATAPDGRSATLSLESSESTLPQYPWAFEAEMEFALNAACLRITTRVRNTGTEAMPFGLGFHPYFQVGDKARVAVSTNATRAYDSVAKQAIAFAGFDLTAAEVDVRLLDHSLQSSELSLGDGTRVVLRASPQFTQWVVWTLAGKEFVCLEPWTAPGNAFNTGEGLISLAPGGEKSLWMEIEFVE